MTNCVCAAAELGGGRGYYDLELCKQGGSGRRGRLASMHTSTGDGKDTLL